MVSKVNGAAYPGIWVEKKVAFIKVVFNASITALPATSTFVAGTTTATGTGTVSDSSFAVVESAVVQALKTIGTKATILGVSGVGTGGTTVDVMVGFAEGFFADLNGNVLAGVDATTAFAGTVGAAKAVVTTAGTGTVVGQLVDVAPGTFTYAMKFAYMDGTMTVATSANKGVVLGVGSTSGAFPYPGSPSGIANFYPSNSLGIGHEG